MPGQILGLAEAFAAHELFPLALGVHDAVAIKGDDLAVRVRDRLVGVYIREDKLRANESSSLAIVARIERARYISRDPLERHSGDRILLVVSSYLVPPERVVEANDVRYECAWLLPGEPDRILRGCCPGEVNWDYVGEFMLEVSLTA